MIEENRIILTDNNKKVRVKKGKEEEGEMEKEEGIKRSGNR